MKVTSFKKYLKEDTSEIVFAFGRFNPPTIGHEKLFDAVKKLARGSQYRIYPSQSQDPKKNPLDFKLKVKFLRKMFTTHARNIMADKGVRNAFDVVVKLYDQGYTKVTMVAGEDRVIEFEKLLNKYNGSKGRHGFYQFENGIIVKGIKVSHECTLDFFEERVRAFSKNDLHTMLITAGLENIQVKGTDDLSTYEEVDSERMIFIAQKPLS